jgi:hypothetical protein
MIDLSSLAINGKSNVFLIETKQAFDSHLREVLICVEQNNRPLDLNYPEKLIVIA